MESFGRTVSFNVAPGDIIAGRYELQGRLGAGGMGQVFRAVDRELDGEIVALKLLLPHLNQDEQVFRRFRNEVLVARSLTHPNIVRTHDIGKTAEGYSYISMEFVDGESLRDRLIAAAQAQEQDPAKSQGKAGPPLEFEEALSYFYQIICGVAYAHGKGVIHRDLKPANVLMSKKNEIKLADFGTARIVGADTSLTQTGQVIGTPDYMSPEQIRGEELDTGCDIYALGILAYELVSGKRPFMADSAVAVAFKHLNEPLPSLITPNSRAPMWFDEIVKKAAAKKKTDRFASVNDLAGALLDFAPELSAQSTLFSGERGRRGTGSYTAGSVGASAVATIGTGAGAAVGSSSGGAATGFSDAKTALDAGVAQTNGRSFEFGASNQSPGNHQHAREDEGGWKLGVSSFQEDHRPHHYFETKKTKGTKNILWGLVFILALLLALPRLHQGTADSIQGILFKEGEASAGSVALFLGALFGVHPPEEAAPIFVAGRKQPSVNGIDASIPSSTAVQNSAVQNSAGQNSAGQNTTSPAVVSQSSGVQNSGPQNPTSPQVQPSAQPQPSLVLNAKQEHPEKRDAHSETSPATETGSQAAPVSNENSPRVNEPEKPAIAAIDKPASDKKDSEKVIEKVVGSLVLRENGVSLRDASVSVDRLSQLSWSAELSGVVSAESDSEAKLRERIQIEVYDLRRSQVAALLRVDQLNIANKSEGVLKLSGGFQSLRATQPSSGSFEVRLSYKGEEISQKDLVLYRAQVTSTASTNGMPYGTTQAGAGGSTIIISSEPGKAQAAPSSAPSVSQVPTVSNPPPVAVTQSSGNSTVPSNSGLPVAKGHINTTSTSPLVPPPSTTLANQPSTQTAGVGDAESPPIATFSETYVGQLIPSTEGAPSLGIEINIQVSGETLSGTARVSGEGDFTASGKVLARGMEIELRGELGWMRLTSGPRSSALRGRYSYPSKQQSGRFDLRRR